MSKTIFTAAITGGIHTPSMSPHLPITPDQIVEDALSAYEAGAAVVHIHARDPETVGPPPTWIFSGRSSPGSSAIRIWSSASPRAEAWGRARNSVWRR